MLTNIVQLDKVGMRYLDFVGGKNASLGEMLQNLTKLGVNILGGFVTYGSLELLLHEKMERMFITL